MNKYLLLRDNKQTGPYTGEEIIAKGIKPYDLVWLEGKSAAWRYPSEIAELKPYSPAVEEQPYDRFYKKPEPAKEIHDVVSPFPHEPFIPKITSLPSFTKSDRSSGKVYINYPGASRKSSAPKPLPEKSVRNVSEDASTSEYQLDNNLPVPQPLAFRHELPVAEENHEPSPHVVYPKTGYNDRRLLNTTIIACFAMLLLISFLIVNYKNQRHSINELSTIVGQMEQMEDEPIQDVPVSASDVPENNNVSENTGNSIAGSTPSQTVAIAAANKISNTSNKQKASILPATTRQASGKRAETGNAEILNQPAEESVVVNTESTENLYKLVSVKTNEYKTGILGGISGLQLELFNNSHQKLQKVFVEIRYLGPEKKIVRTRTVSFENILPGAHSMIEVPKSNRGVTVDYTITNIKS